LNGASYLHELIDHFETGPDKEGMKLVAIMVEKRHISLSKRSEKTGTALHYAVKKGLLELVKYLLEHGAKVTQQIIDSTSWVYMKELLAKYQSDSNKDLMDIINSGFVVKKKAPPAIVIKEQSKQVSSLQQQRQQDKVDESLCIICMDEKKEILLEPCNHLIYCTACSKIAGEDCPLCQARIKNKKKIFT
jgi:hypothetical protein